MNEKTKNEDVFVTKNDAVNIFVRIAPGPSPIGEKWGGNTSLP